jgi:hypothetical protein
MLFARLVCSSCQWILEVLDYFKRKWLQPSSGAVAAYLCPTGRFLGAMGEGAVKHTIPCRYEPSLIPSESSSVASSVRKWTVHEACFHSVQAMAGMLAGTAGHPFEAPHWACRWLFALMFLTAGALWWYGLRTLESRWDESFGTTSETALASQKFFIFPFPFTSTKPGPLPFLARAEHYFHPGKRAHMCRPPFSFTGTAQGIMYPPLEPI